MTKAMFEYLDAFNVVLVTGPQRSGTTLVARAIARDTGLYYLDEHAFAACFVGAWKKIIKHARRKVVQCPAMTAFVDEPGIGDREDLAVVFVLRPVEEIIASQERIGWAWEDSELVHYDASEGPIAQVKYDHWFNVQRHRVANSFNVVYRDLEQHPLWVPEDRRRRRRDWGVRSWR